MPADPLELAARSRLGYATKTKDPEALQQARREHAEAWTRSQIRRGLAKADLTADQRARLRAEIPGDGAA